MKARATEQVSATDERFVVWSPDTTTCMIWTSRARAEQFAQFWRDTRLLGSHGWRVGRVVAEPRETETESLAVRQALAAVDPVLSGGAAAGSMRPFNAPPSRTVGRLDGEPLEARLRKAGPLEAGRPEAGQPGVGLLEAQRLQAGSCRARSTTDEPLATARDEFVALLAAKDALIAQLRHQVNDLTLATVREAAAQGRRIAELERRLAESTRRGGGR